MTTTTKKVRVYRDGQQVAEVNAGTKAYSDKGLTAATTYKYVVRAVDDAGTLSDPSNELSQATKASGSNGGSRSSTGNGSTDSGSA